MSSIPLTPIWMLTALLIVFNFVGLRSEKLNWTLRNAVDRFYIGDIGKSQFEQENSPTGTIIINLPIIEQNVPTSTPVPNNSYPAPDSGTESPPGTPTPTPIPVQTGSANLPIVIGALAIITVILLAWFFVGYLPSRSKE